MKNNKPAEEKKTPAEKLLDSFDGHIKTVKAIIEDYVGGPGMELEVQAAHDNFREKVEALNEDADIEYILKQLKDMPLDSSDLTALVEFIDKQDTEVLDDWSTENDYMNTDNCVCVKVNNIRDREKIEEFIKREIYPAYNDQTLNIIS